MSFLQSQEQPKEHLENSGGKSDLVFGLLQGGNSQEHIFLAVGVACERGNMFSISTSPSHFASSGMQG